MATTNLKKVCKIEGVTLNLDVAESKALYLTLRSVGGSPDNSIRKYIDSIYTSLEKAGLEPLSQTDDSFLSRSYLGIYFKDKTDKLINTLVNIKED